jgi:histidinol-phosphate aminotransferase
VSTALSGEKRFADFTLHKPKNSRREGQMSKFWSPFVKDLVPYVPGEQPKLAKLVKLNTNENPYGPSPKAIAAMQAEVNDNLRLYPDPNSDRLKQAVADYYGVQTAQVFVGNGSDEVLAHAFHGLFQQSQPLLFPDISYSFYPVYCGLYGIDFVQVPLDEQFQIRVEDYARPNGGIIFPNPNAPTGCALALDAIELLLKANPDSVVLVDEAYIDFGGETAISLVDKYPNLLVSQTLSKSRSLAGLRVGIAVGHPDLIEALERIKNSFNSYPLDRMAIAGAAAAFEDKAYFEQTCQRVIDSRDAVVAGLETLGFEVLPSAANFVFARHPGKDAATLAAGLREQGVIVRHFKQQRIAQFLRITIGTPEQNQALLDALQDL